MCVCKPSSFSRWFEMCPVQQCIRFKDLVSHTHLCLVIQSETSLQITPKWPCRTACGCARHCFEQITHEQRKRLFDGFWNSGNFDVQNTFLCGCVKVSNTKRKCASHESRRCFSCVYYIQNGSVSEQVCKTAFLSFFAVSNGRLSCALRLRNTRAKFDPHK